MNIVSFHFVLIACISHLFWKRYNNGYNVKLHSYNGNWQSWYGNRNASDTSTGKRETNTKTERMLLKEHILERTYLQHT